MLHDLYRAMVIAVIPVRMVQVAIDEIVDVVPVRNWFVPAAGAVNVVGIVSAAVMRWRAIVGVRLGHRNRVFLYFAVVAHPVKMPIVQVVNVILVLDSRMAAIGAMLVRVVLVEVCHLNLLYGAEVSRSPSRLAANGWSSICWYLAYSLSTIVPQR